MLSAALSPNGGKIATLQMFGGGELLEFQIRVVDLATGHGELWGKPARIGGPVAWLPAGKGLILKRYMPMERLDSVEPRILCRMDMDGTITDLRRGDMPVVLSNSRKILFLDDEARLWHTCNLDGSSPELLADGLEGYGFPAVSVDETQVLFVRFERGELPQLLLFDMGAATGVLVTHAKGLITSPIWK